jgi:HSP20 family protein
MEELAMGLTTWNPWQELEALRRDVERAFDDFGLSSRTWPLSRVSFLPGSSARAYPLLNLSEDKDNVYVEALAPGIDTGTLEISVVRDTLRIAGEKQSISSDVKPEAFHRNERSAGKFVRTVDLPAEVNGDKVTAEYKNGLLLVVLPKVEAAKPKQISVKVN